MNFKLRIFLISFLTLGLPFMGHSVQALVEEEVTEDESTVAEDADPEIENHLAERKKKKGKKNISNNGENRPTGRGDIITKGSDDDVVLELDEEN